MSCEAPRAERVVCFTVPGRPVPKARPRGGRGRFYTKPETVAYESSVGREALAVGLTREVGPLTLHVDVWRATRRRYDVDNLLKAVVDGMVKCGALSEDNMTVVTAMSVRHCGVDKARPRVEVTVTIGGAG